jgi:hypothetical protein
LGEVQRQLQELYEPSFSQVKRNQEVGGEPKAAAANSDDERSVDPWKVAMIESGRAKGKMPPQWVKELMREARSLAKIVLGESEADSEDEKSEDGMINSSDEEEPWDVNHGVVHGDGGSSDDDDERHGVCQKKGGKDEGEQIDMAALWSSAETDEGAQGGAQGQAFRRSSLVMLRESMGTGGMVEGRGG